MNINFKQALIDYDGVPVLKTKITEDADGITRRVETDAPILLEDIVISALSASYREDAECKPKDKLERFALSLRIKNAKEGVEVTIEEAALIKKMVTKGCTVLACGRICKLVEDVK